MRDRADALCVYFDPLTNINRLRINIFALAALLPTISAFREFVATGGGLASYGSNTADLFRRADRHRRLLRARRERPRRSRRTAEQRHELAPSDHSITSSARASS